MSQNTLKYLKGLIKQGDSLDFEAVTAPLDCGSRGIQHHYTVSLNGNMPIANEIYLLITENGPAKDFEVIEWLDSTLIFYTDAHAITTLVDSILSLDGTLGCTVYGNE